MPASGPSRVIRVTKQLRRSQSKANIHTSVGQWAFSSSSPDNKPLSVPQGGAGSPWGNAECDEKISNWLYEELVLVNDRPCDVVHQLAEHIVRRNSRRTSIYPRLYRVPLCNRVQASRYPITRSSAKRADNRITIAPVTKTSRSANRRRIRNLPTRSCSARNDTLTSARSFRRAPFRSHPS